MKKSDKKPRGRDITKMELANRLFFRLYQCANMLHKTGSRAIEAEGLTTQQWAVLGALSRGEAHAGMGIGELAKYLMVSRQNLAGLVSRMERDGHISIASDTRDRRSRIVTMTNQAATSGRYWPNPKFVPTTKKFWPTSRSTTQRMHCIICSRSSIT